MPRMGQPHLHSHPPLTRDFVQTQVLRDIQHQDASIQEQPGHVLDRREAVVPNLYTLRTNPGISEAVNNLLASYEGQANSDLSQGKPQGKKSGRYNLHDTIFMAPHLRWPNEGFHPSNGKNGLSMMSCSYHNRSLASCQIYMPSRTQHCQNKPYSR